MYKLGKGIVKSRFIFLIAAILLLIPAGIGYLNTRVNYDILSYLPDEIETMKGQDILTKDFGTGAFSFVVIEGMQDKNIQKLADKIKDVRSVKEVLWYSTAADLSIPEEVLPDEVYSFFNNDEKDSKLMILIFEGAMASDDTMSALDEIDGIVNDQCYISGMAAVINDIRKLSMKEAPLYVVIAVILSLVVLSLTMDYSIFLWHSYSEQIPLRNGDKKEAMAGAIASTITSVIGSSITTVAGFISLCFMSFTLGMDLGVVMAKGVAFGVISCVTILPALILVFDKAIEKTRHKVIVPDLGGIASWITKRKAIFLVLFLLILGPALYGYTHTSVYYDLEGTLPKSLESITANDKLEEQYDMGATHMIMADSKLSGKDSIRMIEEIRKLDGVKLAVSLDSAKGPEVPMEMIPENLKQVFMNGDHQLMIVTSEYKTASDEVNRQCDEIAKIIKKYDDTAMLIGEAPCTKDLIEITDEDFARVSVISIGAIFIIILLVFKSISLPVILVAVIEFAIFINMGIPAYTGTTLPFIASIVIGTIQLGATVDYAILMTNKYKTNRYNGMEKQEAITKALKESIQSIIVSALSFFAATFGVEIYSNIDMISSLCNLMARGAVISMCVVILVLPSMFMLFDKMICVTSAGFRKKQMIMNILERENE